LKKDFLKNSINMKMAKKKKKNRKQTTAFQWITTGTVLILVVAGLWMGLVSEKDDSDLSAIGQGQNIVVQIHDPN